MSEPIPESIPTSSSVHPFHRPTKKMRMSKNPSTTTVPRSSLHPTATDVQAIQINSLMSNPDQHLPNLSTKSKNGSYQPPPPPEIVPNVQGSSAGAGSGEFHVYKASRRREYERLRAMEEEVQAEEADEKWRREKEEREERDRREWQKKKRRRKKGKTGGGGKEDVQESDIGDSTRGENAADAGSSAPEDRQNSLKSEDERGIQNHSLHAKAHDSTETASELVPTVTTRTQQESGVAKHAGIVIHDDD